MNSSAQQGLNVYVEATTEVMAVSTLKGGSNINEKEVEAFPCCELIHSEEDGTIYTDRVFIKDHLKVSISREFKEE